MEVGQATGDLSLHCSCAPSGPETLWPEGILPTVEMWAVPLVTYLAWREK